MKCNSCRQSPPSLAGFSTAEKGGLDGAISCTQGFWADDPPQLKTHWVPNQLPEGNLLIGVAQSGEISGYRARSRTKSRCQCVPGVDIGLWAAPLHCSGRNTLPTPVGDVADRWLVWMQWGPRELHKPEERRHGVLSSSRCAGLLTAARDDAAEMTVAIFAEAWFVDVSDSMPWPAIFLPPWPAIFLPVLQHDSAFAVDIEQEQLPCWTLAAVPCSTWQRVSSIVTVEAGIRGTEPPPRRRQCQTSPGCILFAGLSLVSGLSNMAQLRSREAAGGARAHCGDSRAAARLERCVASEEHRGESLCG